MSAKRSDDELLQELHKLAEELGQTPTAGEMDEQGAFSADTYRNRFGNWTDAVQAAGLRMSWRGNPGLSKEQLLTALQDFADKLGKPPSSAEMNVLGPHASSTYTDRFGSWDDALRAAGLDPSKIRTTEGTREELPDALSNGEDKPKISGDELIEVLQDLADDLGRTPTTAEMDEQGPYSSSTYTGWFGSWDNALRAAGLEVNQYRISDEQLRTALQDLADDLGRTPTTAEMNEQGRYSSMPYRDRFDTWDDALRAADLEVDQCRISDEQLRTALQDLADDLGRTPMTAEMNEQGPYSTPTYRDRFGSWAEALRAAGLGANLYQNITLEQLLLALQDLADDLGRTPTTAEMDEQGRFSSATYLSRFDTWDDALRAAGLGVKQGRNGSPNISQEVLLDALRELAGELGETPTAAKMNKQGQFSSSTYKRRFGRWNDALRAAGFEPNKQGPKISENKLIEALQDLADEIGKRPTSEEMDHWGEYSSTTYRSHFGSWPDALRAAGLINMSRRESQNSDTA